MDWREYELRSEMVLTNKQELGVAKIRWFLLILATPATGTTLEMTPESSSRF